MIFIDFESFSAADIKSVGHHAYARHPSTRILCMAWAIDDGPVSILRSDTPMPIALESAFRDGVESIETAWAWNANFERAIITHCWDRWRPPPTRNAGNPHPWNPKPTRFQCSQALAASCGLPLHLGACATFLHPSRPDLQKDKRGEDLIKLCCIPDKDGKQPVLSAELRQELEAYCMQDVVAERAVHHALPVKALNAIERRVWELDHHINDRGFLVDVPFITGALRLRTAEKVYKAKRTAEITHGWATAPTQVAKVVNWIRAQGCDLANGTAEAVTDCLAAKPPPAVAELLRLRQAGSLTSLGKLARALVVKCDDDRVRGAFHFNGAQVTGRWAAKGLQPQNFPRPKADRSYLIDAIRQADAETIRLMAGDVGFVLRDCLRHCIIAPPGKTLAICDINAVEARVAGWLADEPGYLEAFRTGANLYKQTAGLIYGCHAETIVKGSHEYDVGKAAALSLQYGSGADSFCSKCKHDGIHISLALAQRIVRVYRNTYQGMPRAWRKLESLAVMAIQNPGKSLSYRGILRFEAIKGFLRMWLPSGRAVYYACPEIQFVDTGYGPKPSLVVRQDVAGAMRRVHIWGGVLFNNAVQGMSRDLLAGNMLDIEPFAPIVLHAHDEIASEIETGGAAEKLQRMERIMSTAPAWAPGLPLKAEAFLSRMYKK
jgi:DNA polymerase